MTAGTSRRCAGLSYRHRLLLNAAIENMMEAYRAIGNPRPLPLFSSRPAFSEKTDYVQLCTGNSNLTDDPSAVRALTATIMRGAWGYRPSIW